MTEKDRVNLGVMVLRRSHDMIELLPCLGGEHA